MEKTILISLPIADLQTVIIDCVNSCLHNQKNFESEQSIIDPEPLIYGIKGLAKFLHVSPPTAQAIKNSGKIPFSQVERTIIFSKADVLEALKKKGGIKRNG